MNTKDFLSTGFKYLEQIEKATVTIRSGVSELQEVNVPPMPASHSDVVLDKQTQLQQLDYLAERLSVIAGQLTPLSNSLGEAVGLNNRVVLDDAEYMGKLASHAA